MNAPAEIAIAALLVIGGVFGAVGSWALVRLPDPMTRLHGPTKAATLGVGAVLVASMAAMWFRNGVLSWHELLVALFLFVTSPLTGLFIAKAHLHLSWQRDELPRPDADADWATYAERVAANPATEAAPPPPHGR